MRIIELSLFSCDVVSSEVYLFLQEKRRGVKEETPGESNQNERAAEVGESE